MFNSPRVKPAKRPLASRKINTDPMPYISGSTGERVRQIPPGREVDFYYLPRIEYKEKDVQLTEDQ